MPDGSLKWFGYVSSQHICVGYSYVRTISKIRLAFITVEHSQENLAPDILLVRLLTI
jgi:hypothetical protein